MQRGFASGPARTRCRRRISRGSVRRRARGWIRALSLGRSGSRASWPGEGMAASKTGVFHSSRYLCAIGTALIIITLGGCGVTIWSLHRAAASISGARRRHAEHGGGQWIGCERAAPEGEWHDRLETQADAATPTR
jgi:hypothetical protein